MKKSKDSHQGYPVIIYKRKLKRKTQTKPKDLEARWEK